MFHNCRGCDLLRDCSASLHFLLGFNWSLGCFGSPDRHRRTRPQAEEADRHEIECSPHEAVRALRTRLVNILDVLDDMGKDQTFSLDTVGGNFPVHGHLLLLVLCPSSLLGTNPERDQHRSKGFQQRGLGLDSTKVRVVGLERFLNESREDFANEAVREAESLCEKMGVTIEKRIPRRKMMPGEKAKDAGLTPKEEIRRQLLSSHDRLCQELSSRFDAIKSTCDIFCLIDILFTKKQHWRGGEESRRGLPQRHLGRPRG